MSKHSGTLFVADDNPVLLQGLERALVTSGYAVQTAESGLALLRLLEQATEPPDLLLLDIMMPEMSGFDVLQHLRSDARWADLPVVLITAATDQQFPVSALRNGAVDFLTKPFRLAELLARVEAHVKRHHEFQRARAESAVRQQVIDVVRDLNSVVAAGEMFRLITTRVAEICRGADCSVLIDQGDGTLRVAASSNPDLEEGDTLASTAHPELLAVLEPNAPLLADPPTVAQPANGNGATGAEAGDVPTLSPLALPFPISEQGRGVLFVWPRANESQLDRETVAVLPQVVQGMTRALGRAQVFETLVEQRRQFHDLAHTDELTGCASRRAVMCYLSDQLGLTRRRNTSLSVVLLDIDHFKRINDTHGHAAGDQVLRSCGEWLRGDSALRAKDCVGRLGGDEFVVVLPETDTDGALRFAERARAHVASMVFDFGDASAPTTLSAGIATSAEAASTSADELLEAADRALYRAKEAGRDCIRLAQRNGQRSEATSP